MLPATDHQSAELEPAGRLVAERPQSGVRLQNRQGLDAGESDVDIEQVAEAWHRDGHCPGAELDRGHSGGLEALQHLWGVAVPGHRDHDPDRDVLEALARPQLGRGDQPGTLPDDLVQEGSLDHRGGERTHPVEGRREVDDAIDGHGAVGRGDADHAAHRGRLPDRPTSVGPQRQDAVRRHRSGASAGRSSRGPSRVVRVAGRTPCGGLGRCAHGQFVEVHGADDHSAGCADPPHHLSVPRARRQRAAGGRTAGPGGATDRDVVLHGHPTAAETALDQRTSGQRRLIDVDEGVDLRLPVERPGLAEVHYQLTRS